MHGCPITALGTRTASRQGDLPAGRDDQGRDARAASRAAPRDRLPRCPHGNRATGTANGGSRVSKGECTEASRDVPADGPQHPTPLHPTPLHPTPLHPTPLHPAAPAAAGTDIVVLRGPSTPGSGAHAKNAVVMSNNELDWDRPETWTGMIDRSPCGTGTCAVMVRPHRACPLPSAWGRRSIAASLPCFDPSHYTGIPPPLLPPPRRRRCGRAESWPWARILCTRAL